MVQFHNRSQYEYEFVDENSVDPHQLASLEASCSGSTLFSISSLEFLNCVCLVH